MKPTPDISWKVNITDYLSASISDLVGIVFAVKMIVYPLDRSQIQMSNATTALFDKCEKKIQNFRRFYLDFWWNWDRYSFNKISVKKFQIDRIIIFGTCNFEVYTFSNFSFIILLSKLSSTGFLIFEIDEKLNLYFLI